MLASGTGFSWSKRSGIVQAMPHQSAAQTGATGREINGAHREGPTSCQDRPDQEIQLYDALTRSRCTAPCHLILRPHGSFSISRLTTSSMIASAASSELLKPYFAQMAIGTVTRQKTVPLLVPWWNVISRGVRTRTPHCIFLTLPIHLPNGRKVCPDVRVGLREAVHIR
jgi:hypothetical protein